MYDIAIIGAGVVGGVIAEALSKYDVKLCIVDKESDVAMGATKANSGIVHAGFDAAEGSLKAKMNVRGSELMEDLCKRLGVKYINNEALVVAFEDEREDVEALYKRGLANGVKGLKLIERDEMAALEPNLNPELSCALLATTSAIVCPYGLCIAAIGNAMDNGAELLLDFEVGKIDKENGFYELHSCDGRKISAKYVINSAGIMADKVADMTGEGDFSISAGKGEYILLDKECGDFTQRTVFHTPTKKGKGVLITPTVDGNLLVGPTFELVEDRNDTATTVEGIERIFADSERSVANIPYSKTTTSFVGLRAKGSTGDFIIKEREGVITLGGIESPGLSAAPAFAEYIEGLLKGKGLLGEPKVSYKSTRQPAYRFSELSTEEKNKIIKNDKTFGRIICRCEGITEGEIIEAIKTNPPARDLDGVKRRTRSGMGRCQGGFCSPAVAAIISRERGIPLENVTKFGGGSVINYGKTKGSI